MLYGFDDSKMPCERAHQQIDIMKVILEEKAALHRYIFSDFPVEFIKLFHIWVQDMQV